MYMWIINILKKMDKAKVSKLRLNTTDGRVIGAELAIRDSQGYEAMTSRSNNNRVCRRGVKTSDYLYGLNK